MWSAVKKRDGRTSGRRPIFWLPINEGKTLRYCFTTWIARCFKHFQMNNSRKSLIVFSAFVLTYFGEIAINIACGPEPASYDYYVSYFHNNTPGYAYVPFSFTGLRFLYDENEPESESLINSREWARYLGKQVTAADVGAIMYRTDAATDSLIAGYLTGSPLSLPDSLQHNTYLLAMV